MQIKIEVNGQSLTASRGDYLLSVLRDHGIRIPTLCSLEEYTPTGACRLCVVEIEGIPGLIPACSFQVSEPIRVRTHSSKVIQARRTIVELLVSGHPDDCLYCFQNKACELQRLAHELNVKQRRGAGKRSSLKTDRTSQALHHDPSKCVLCGRCIRICDDQQVSAIEFIGRGNALRVGTAGDRGLAHSNCIACGQCIQACPTGSLSERGELEELLVRLQEGHPKVVALVDPAVMVSAGNELGFRPGKDISGYLFSALRKTGFSQVFSGSEMVDASLMISARAWVRRLLSGQTRGLISYCPAWTKYLEKLRPDLLDLVLPVHRPAQLFGRWMKELDPETYVVYISPCVAAKTDSKEIANTAGAKPFVDCVLSTRELIQLVMLYGIEFERINPEVPDLAFGSVRISGMLPAVSGGYLEALARALWVLDPQSYPLQKKISRFRGVKVCKTSLMGDFVPEQKWTACSSLSTVFDLLDRPHADRQPELFEVMACQGGCINGGGQPGLRNEKTTRNRIREIYDADAELSGMLTDFVSQTESLEQAVDELTWKS